MDSIPKQINQFYLPEWLTMELIAGNVISFTPLFSYGTTILSIYKKESSVGFSIDICATMLIAASLRIAYYFIIPFEMALFRQSIVMIFIQIMLLKVSLTYRAKEIEPKNKSTRFVEDIRVAYVDDIKEDYLSQGLVKFGKSLFVITFSHFVRFFDPRYQRVGKFWQWESQLAYWRFLFRFEIGLLIVTLIFQDYLKFGEFLGTVGLFVESLLPLPQILLLNKVKSVEGFKLLLLLSWLCGDATKISYLIFGAKNISGIFLFFALFQMFQDFYIAFQYVYFKYHYVPPPESIEMNQIRV